MPRQYTCRKCGVPHAPPTGKKCNRREEALDENVAMAAATPATQLLVEPDAIATLTELMLDIRAKVENIDERVKTVETGKEKDAPAPEEGAGIAASALEVRQEREEVPTVADLRNDMRAMQKAVERMSQLSIKDSDDEDKTTTSRTKKNGKKSGSTMLATQIVDERIDWPQLYVVRTVAGNRTPVPYKELRIEEFVYGFLMMIDSPKCKWDRDVMLEILKMLMQDTMDFAWENARAFYEMVGVDVEYGLKKWDDTEAIMKARLLHSRTVLPEKKENKETKKPAGNKLAGQGTKCCAPYQQRSCEQSRDHLPFVHACAYCAKATGVLYKHPETDCYRKTFDKTKNGEKGE